MTDEFFERGWISFTVDPAILDWLDAAEEAARRAVADPAHSQWHRRCGGTWFAGVNALATRCDRNRLPADYPCRARRSGSRKSWWGNGSTGTGRRFRSAIPAIRSKARARATPPSLLSPRPGRRPCRRAAAGRTGAPAVPARASPLHPWPADRTGGCGGVTARRVGRLPPHRARDLCQDLRRHTARNVARCRRYRGLSCRPTAHFRGMPARDRHRRKGRGLSGAPARPARHRALGRRRDGRGADGDLFSPRIGRPHRLAACAVGQPPFDTPRIEFGATQGEGEVLKYSPSFQYSPHPE